MLERDWPRDLPEGVIHADLFPDNVFFLGDKLSGLIDFYFACTDTLVYDVAICLNAWCFEPDHSYNVTKGRALLANYAKTRPLSAPEWAKLPLLARGAALRFLLTRLVDWLDVPPGALVRPKDPLEYLAQAALPPDGQERARLRSDRAVSADLPDVVIHTDGACSGNPGPGGWGAILTFGDHEKELKGGEALTTNNRMELMAAISALEALKRPCRVDLHTDSQYLRNGITTWIGNWKRNGWRTADKKPVKNVDLWKRLEAALGATPDALALGARPRRSRHERARRRTGARGHRRDCGWRGKSGGEALSRRLRDDQSCLSSASAPELSALPGASSTLSFFTTPSSTSIE